MFLNVAMFITQGVMLFVTKIKTPLLIISQVSLGDNRVHGFQSDNQRKMKFLVSEIGTWRFTMRPSRSEVLGERYILHLHQEESDFYSYVTENLKFCNETKQNLTFYTGIKENVKFYTNKENVKFYTETKNNLKFYTETKKNVKFYIDIKENVKFYTDAKENVMLYTDKKGTRVLR